MTSESIRKRELVEMTPTRSPLAAWLASMSAQGQSHITKPAMTPASFTAWLAEMKSAGLARSDAECGRLLGRSADMIVRYKQNGADRVVALACRALLHRLEEYA